MIKVSVASPQESVAIDRARMRQIVRTVLEGEHIANAEISIAFVDNATSQQLNKRYLKHDEPTDILTFPLSEADGKLLGELVVGAEVAHAQAQERGHDVQAELALYVIHGLLHLCGFNDKSKDQVTDMRRRELHYLGILGLPDISEKEINN